jgi:HEAT repeat protein
MHTRTGTWGRHEPDAGLMEGLTPGKPKPDADNDGMPDEWEKAHGLDANDASDANKTVPAGASRGDRHRGYTYIEFYINELADNLVAQAYAEYRLADEPTRKDFGPATRTREPLKPVDELVAAITEQSHEWVAKKKAEGGRLARYAYTDTQRAWYAVQMLSRMGSDAKSAVKPLIERIENKFDDSRAVVFAIYGLGAIGPAAGDAVPTLIKVMDHDYGIKGLKWHFWPNGWAAWALGRIGPDARQAVPALAEAMSGKDVRGRDQAAWALSRMGPHAVGALDALAKEISGGSYAMRCHTRDALVNIGEPAVPALVKAIESGKAIQAAEAAGCLGRLARPALPGLVAMAADAEPQARAAAVEAICRIDPTAEGAVQAATAALSDKDMFVRHRTAKALGEAGPAAGPAVGALAKALADKAPEVRGAAAEALGRVGSTGVAPLVKALAESGDPWVRLKCARALGRVKPQAKDAIAPLVGAMEDKHEGVRLEAVLALSRMGPAARAARDALRVAADDGDYMVAVAAAQALKRPSGGP